jgi:hypothetical protein
VTKKKAYFSRHQDGEGAQFDRTAHFHRLEQKLAPKELKLKNIFFQICETSLTFAKISWTELK